MDAYNTLLREIPKVGPGQTPSGQAAQALVKAIEINLHAQVPMYSGLPGCKACAEPNVLGLLTDLDPSESCVYRCACTSRQAPRRIERVLQEYRSHGCLPMYWQVGPGTLPLDLGTYLAAQGFVLSARVPAMAANLAELEGYEAAPGRLLIEPVTQESQLRHWTRIVAAADEVSEALQAGFVEMFKSARFGTQDHSQLFLGTVDGRPLAASRLFCAGGVAGIYGVATLPQARGQGYGTAMTLAAARAGLKLGYRVGVLYASPSGYPLYRRLGFEEYFHLDVYKSPA